MGVMFIVTALALAGVGITYAGWTDTITVSGSVDTGDVDFDVESYSGTWVYKIDPHGIERLESQYNGSSVVVPTPTGTPIGGHDGNDWVAAAWAEPTTDNDVIVDDSVTITFDNLFPCQDFVADFIVHYEGSIPARIAGSHIINTDNVGDGDQYLELGPQYSDDSDANWMEDLWACYQKDPGAGFGIWIEAYRATQDDNGGWIIQGEQVDNGVQVHNCEYLWFKVIIHIPQNNAYQGCYGEFDMQLTAIQWDSFDEIDPLMPDA